jgi:hypothetical protein
MAAYKIPSLQPIRSLGKMDGNMTGMESKNQMSPGLFGEMIDSKQMKSRNPAFILGNAAYRPHIFDNRDRPIL